MKYIEIEIMKYIKETFRSDRNTNFSEICQFLKIHILDNITCSYDIVSGCDFVHNNKNKQI